MIECAGSATIANASGETVDRLKAFPNVPWGGGSLISQQEQPKLPSQHFDIVDMVPQQRFSRLPCHRLRCFDRLETSIMGRETFKVLHCFSSLHSRTPRPTIARNDHRFPLSILAVNGLVIRHTATSRRIP